ncbi:hypothetical protein RS3R6_09290 [Pseudomonas atacamensis]|uniref:helix-turn-helix domain-containing protein n=1 Tax=Pseudomonas atacamensis TaxID=2565368 RepID=UPI0022CCEF76|nr:helix-turn-helix transcriptional regulator [Pseudomonas atacamensis]GLH52748.1 hypothetical protein RS3R6_09290 [Pseudomonas atacamensis]
MLSQPCRTTPLIGAPASASEITDSKSYRFIHHMMCNCTRLHGYILSFEDIVLLKPALAAVVRTIREKLGFTQENLANAASRTYLSKIENAVSSPTVEKFAELAEALGLSPTALMALVVSTRDNTSVAAILTKAHDELDNLGAKVSAEDIRQHLSGVEVAKRPASRPADIAKLQKVLACKEAGLTKAETARRLGLTRSTVGFLWERSLTTED